MLLCVCGRGLLSGHLMLLCVCVVCGRGLLSGHLMVTELRRTQNVMSWYNGELLHMAHDIGNRLLPAFNTSTGMPFPRVCFSYCFCAVTMNIYLRQGGYVIVIVCFFVDSDIAVFVPQRVIKLQPINRLFICLSFIFLLATLCKNFLMYLHEIFRGGWNWVSEQMIKLCQVNL